MIRFISAYVKSMRLYYSFITGIAGWLGMSFYDYIARSSYQITEIPPSTSKKGVILILLFLSWGINQIFNDFLGLKEDRINAPMRPMVTGELNARNAVLVSVALLIISVGIVWWYLEPIALIPLLIGVVLNIVYEQAKGHGIMGNIVFGLMITMCSIFGFLAAGPTTAPYFTHSRVSVLILVWVINGLMTFYTYFKDYKGDRHAGKETIVVKYGLRSSRVIAILSSFLPSILFLIIYNNGLIEARVNETFVILGLLTVFLQVWTGVLYFKNPVGKETYYSLATNFRACTCGQAALVALFNSELAMLLFIISYVFVGFLFDLHTNTKS